MTRHPTFIQVAHRMHLHPEQGAELFDSAVDVADVDGRLVGLAVGVSGLDEPAYAI